MSVYKNKAMVGWFYNQIYKKYQPTTTINQAIRIHFYQTWANDIYLTVKYINDQSSRIIQTLIICMECALPIL